MSGLRLKRILRDTQQVSRRGADGVYFWHDPEHVDRACVMMVGDADTPYAHGFFFFSMRFPEEYPFKPPEMTYLTTDGKTRYNPNLYVNGKVCLSVLNTWSGPTWTACNTIQSVLLSIKSMIFGVKYPLENEPSLALTVPIQKQIESGTYDADSMAAQYPIYNEYIEYNVMRHAIAEQYLHLPAELEVFRQDMCACLEQSYDSVLARLEERARTTPKRTIHLRYSGVHTYELNYVDVLHTYRTRLTPQFRKVNVEREQSIDRSTGHNTPPENTYAYIKTISIDAATRDVVSESMFKCLSIANDASMTDTETDSAQDLTETEIDSIAQDMPCMNDLMDIERLDDAADVEAATHVADVEDATNVADVEAATHVADVADVEAATHVADVEAATNVADVEGLRRRRCPSVPAKTLPENTVVVSENDGRQYIARGYDVRKFVGGEMKTVHVVRWVLHR